MKKNSFERGEIDVRSNHFKLCSIKEQKRIKSIYLLEYKTDFAKKIIKYRNLFSDGWNGICLLNGQRNENFDCYKNIIVKYFFN